MIQRRLESTSTKARRRRISEIPSPSLPSDERDLSDDDLAVALRESFRAEGKRIRDAIRREIGGDILSVVQEGLRNMSRKARRRVLSFLDRRLAGQ